MNREDMITALEELNKELRFIGVRVEIGLYGEKEICLALNVREATHNIEALFEPNGRIRSVVQDVGTSLGLDEDWINDAVKGLVSDKNDMIVLSKLSNIDINTAFAPYILAMKVMSYSADNIDEIDDIKYLLRYLNIKSVEQVLDVINSYYPVNKVLPETHNMLEKVFGDML